MIRPTRILLLSLVLGACTTHRSPPPQDDAAPDSTVPEKKVQAEFGDGAVVDFWMAETLTWTMRSRTLRQEDHSERVWAKPVDLVAYDKKGQISARVKADSGTMDKGMRYFRAWGHVVGSNKGGMELRTDSIVFDKESNQIHTAARVRVKTEVGDVLTGRGFRSDSYLNRWEILSDVRGQLRDLSSFPFGGL